MHGNIHIWGNILCCLLKWSVQGEIAPPLPSSVGNLTRLRFHDRHFKRYWRWNDMSEHFNECPREFSGNHGCYGKRKDWAKLFACIVLALRLEYFHKCQPHQRALQWTRRSCREASISGIMLRFQMLVKYLGT